LKLGYLLTALAATLWGTWPLWLRPSGVAPAAQATLVLGTIGVVGLPLLLGRGRARPERRAADWAGIALLGLLDASNVALYFAALGAGAVAMAVLSHYLAPVLVAVLAPRLLGERLGRRTPIAIVGALIGLSILLLPSALSARGGPAVRAALLGAASAIFYAGNVVVSKRLMRRFLPVELLVYHSACAALLLLPWAWHALATTELHGILRVGAGGLLLGLGGGLAFYAGLSRVPAPHVGVLTYLEPLVAIAVGAIFFAEAVSPLGGIGGLLIVVAGLGVITEKP
jgi:drug/metabolite transporter (DMT)-like permease